MEKFNLYVCSDGFLVWYGKRGIDEKITYNSYSKENYNFVKIDVNIDQVVSYLKSGRKLK